MADTALGPGDRSSTNPAPADAAYTTTQVSTLLTAIEHAGARLLEHTRELDDTSVHRPALLPGWTRAHVLSHIARQADGCVNLLLWARSGVEHAMYASDTDRDADIDEGANRSAWLLREDIAASGGRLASAARGLPPAAWHHEVVGESGEAVPAFQILRLRLLEVWTHLVDLDVGFRFGDIPAADAEQLLEDAAQQLGGRADVPAVSLTVDFDDGRTRTWDLRGTTTEPLRVRGHPADVLGWLLGRSSAEWLEGTAPELPAWM